MRLLTFLLSPLKNDSRRLPKMASFVKQIAIGAAMTIIIATASAQSAAPAQRPPNIIVILADDLGCGDLSLYDGWVKTPRIDRMAKEGMTFTEVAHESNPYRPCHHWRAVGVFQNLLHCKIFGGALLGKMRLRFERWKHRFAYIGIGLERIGFDVTSSIARDGHRLRTSDMSYPILSRIVFASDNVCKSRLHRLLRGYKRNRSLGKGLSLIRHRSRNMVSRDFA